MAEISSRQAPASVWHGPCTHSMLPSLQGSCCCALQLPWNVESTSCIQLLTCPSTRCHCHRPQIVTGERPKRGFLRPPVVGEECPQVRHQLSHLLVGMLRCWPGCLGQAASRHLGG